METNHNEISETSIIMGKRILQKRTEYHLTQEQLADKLGVKRQAVCKWERGAVADIKRSLIAKMSEIFHCDPVWLMALDDAAVVNLTYHAPGKQPLNVTVDRDKPIIGESSLRAKLYQAALAVKSTNLEVAIQLLESLSKDE